MTADEYFEFTAKCLVGQIDILGEWLTYDRESDTFSFPANQWDVLKYEQNDFRKVLETHLAVFNAYKNIYNSLYAGEDGYEEDRPEPAIRPTPRTGKNDLPIVFAHEKEAE